MAERNKLTQAALEDLGAARLARALLDHAEQDDVLRRKLQLLMVGAASPARLADDIAKRLQVMARGRSAIDGEKIKATARELDDLRRAIVDQLAPARLGDALDRLWQMLAMAPRILHRIEFGGSRIEAAFAAVVADLGRLSAQQPDRDPEALAERITLALDADRGLVTADLIAAMAPALGAEGRAALRRRGMAALALLPRLQEREDWAVRGQRMEQTARLLALADVEADADAYAAAVRAGGVEAFHAFEVARRLAAAGRPAEALDWLDRFPARAAPDAELDLRLATLEALGRRDEAQGLRWRFFEQSLSSRHLRDHLKHLPDFADFEAEQRALDHVAACPHADAALAFLVEWPDLGRAARLVESRLGEFRSMPGMQQAGAALDFRHPLAALRLRRRLVEDVLEQGRSEVYADAVIALVDAGSSAKRAEAASLETHPAFVDRLRQRFGRKYKFWHLYDETR
ncbi:hypothetical protein EDC65_0016 [Stella humosa]|uniref:Uncharacterized protein n=1 Tax=Stella humosa TaxID=94 RepID=A0A3N1M752_9PROT|nr:DUF6880 family protein [Stella humosa]ROQ03334.1 hypothetical protein EDC65_0016 [Stella humosa]BBK29621.1 hypothetical protein STHU_02550 [Stella humosa]